MSNFDINVDRRTDGLTDGWTDGRKSGRLYRTLLQVGATKNNRSITNDVMFVYMHEKINILFSLLSIFVSFFSMIST